MTISSTLLALNYLHNFDETENAETCAICIVQRECRVDLPSLEVSECQGIERVFPIHHDDSDLAVLLIFDNVEEGLRRAKRVLWEKGLLLSAKIVQIKPELRVLKEFGEGE